MGPAPVTETSGLDIGPHPHTGLQTVTWLLDGGAAPRQPRQRAGHPGRPAQPDDRRARRGPLRGGHRPLPRPGARGPAVGPSPSGPGTACRRAPPRAAPGRARQRRRDRPGRQLRRGQLPGPARQRAGRSGHGPAPGRSVWPLDPTFEYALVVLDGQALVQGRPVRPAAGLPGPRPRPAGAGGGRSGAGPAAGRRAVRRAHPDVVELRRPHPEEIAAAARQWRSADPASAGSTPLPRLRVPPLPRLRPPGG